MEKQKSITQILLEKYQKNTTETSTKINLNEANKLYEYESYFYDELPNINVNGYPIGSDFVDEEGSSYSMNEYERLSIEKQKKCKLRYHYLPLTHEFYIGTTGSGKTTGCVEPNIRAIAYQKNKPNMFITDPKGELYNHNALFLEKQGYKIFLLNFKDIEKSDRWNPLLDIYDSYMRLKKFKENPIFINSSPSDKLDLSRFNTKQNYHYKFNNMAFSSNEDFKIYKNYHTDLIKSETDSLIKQFCHMFCPVENKHDPSWETGGRDAVEGIIQCMLDEALNEEKTGFTKDMFTIKTIFDYIEALRQLIVVHVDDDYVDLEDLPFIKGKIRAIEKLSTVYANSPKTMRNYVGVLDSQISGWNQGHIFSLTTGNTINIDNLDQPFAIFLITRDYEKSDFKIAGLFIDAIYKKLLLSYENNKEKDNVKLNHTHFLLDEFGNIPKIENFDNKIATCRSRNIWMHLFLQSYEQLSLVYGNDEAEIILSNCNSQIFLGSQSHKSITRFSKECGQASTRRISDLFSNSYDYIQSYVVKETELNFILPGELYNKRLYSPVIKSQYIRSYFLKNKGYYKDFRNDGLLTIKKEKYNGYSGDKYTYKMLRDYNKYSIRNRRL